MDLYKDLIIDHYQNPRNFGDLENPTIKKRLENALCGDMVEMAAIVMDGKIKDIKFKGIGCAISIATSSMLTEKVKGMDLDMVEKINEDDILKMLGITLMPNRMKCALLPLEVLHELTRLRPNKSGTSARQGKEIK